MGNIEKMGKGEGAGEGGERDWNHGLFGCFHDCGNCMCGYCCPICQVADSASKLGESYLIYFILGCFVPCIPIFMVRDKVRDRYGIDGSAGGDAAIALVVDVVLPFKWPMN